ncbi:hypothetical protein HPP92_011739 [Vanilla planifolia]|uniref:HTH three-helical bundle domain-containing protein n=1 Tax=Vanilla planifolia TaxID=51239 RepID=A0A835V4P9_VANPL|nr:hypothetical protein HPP92_011739 [Vanilla planifolia]
MRTTEFPSSDERAAASSLVLLSRRASLSRKSLILYDRISTDYRNCTNCRISTPISSPSFTFYGSEVHADLLCFLHLTADSHLIQPNVPASPSFGAVFSDGSELSSDQRLLALPAGFYLSNSSSSRTIPKKARSRIHLKQRNFKNFWRSPISFEANDGYEAGMEASTLSSCCSNIFLGVNYQTAVTAEEDSASSEHPRSRVVSSKRERRQREKYSVTLPKGVQRMAEAIVGYLSTQWVSEAVIRAALGNNADTSKALRLLLRRGEIKRSGCGGKTDPFQYTIVAERHEETNCLDS